MKKILILFVFMGFFFNSNGQLKLLFGYPSQKNEKIGDVYNDFGFSVAYSSNKYVINNISGDSNIYIPDRKSYYEMYNKKYLIATELDSSYILKGLSTAPYIFPRHKVFLFSTSPSTIPKKYCVDFKGLIIIDWKNRKDFDLEDFYTIKKIDVNKKLVILRNGKTKKRIKFALFAAVGEPPTQYCRGLVFDQPTN